MATSVECYKPDESAGEVMLLPTTTEEAEIDLREDYIARGRTTFARTGSPTAAEKQSRTDLLRPGGDLAPRRQTVTLVEKLHFERPQPRLFERQEYLDEIAARLSDGWPYSNGAIVIEGARWTGRTALLGAVCRLAGEEHFKVLRARGDDLESCAPWGIVRQLFGIEALRPTRSQSTAAPLLTSTDGAEPGLSEQLAVHYADLEAMLDEAASTSLLLLAVDDAHLADAESAGWLLYVARHLSRRVRLLLTAAHAQRGTPLTAVDRLRSDPSTRLMTLQPLSRDGTAALLGSCLKSDADQDLVDGAQMASGGSPFLVAAIGRALSRLRSSGRSLDGLKGTLAPPEVGRGVLGRLAALPADTPSLLALLESVAVLDTAAQLGSCAQLAGLEFARAATLADCLVDDGLLAAGLPLRFEHQTVRASLLQEMGSARRSRIHLAAARLFEQRGEPPAMVAKHLLVAEQYGDPWVAHHLEEAGREALGRGDRATALTFLSQALSQDPQAAGPRLLLDLAAASAEADVSAATRHLRRAVELGADPAEAARTALALARTVPDGGTFPALVTMLEDMAPRVPAAEREMQIEVELATADLSGSARRAAQAHAAIASTLGTAKPVATRGERLGLALMATVVSTSPRSGGAAEVAQLASVALAPSELTIGDPWAVRLRARALLALAQAGAFDQAEGVGALAIDQAKSLEDPAAAAEYSVSRARAWLWQGRLAEAEAQASSALEVMAGRPWRTRPVALACLVGALTARGRAEEALALLEIRSGDFDLVNPSPEGRHLLEQRGWALLTAERAGEALCDFELAKRWAEHDGVDNPGATSWRSGAAACLFAQGKPDEALRLANENLALASRFDAPWLIGAALVDAAAASPMAARVSQLREAVKLLEDAGAPLVLARALIGLGGELRRDGVRGPEAIEVLSRGADLAFRCGATGLVNQASTALRAAGARPRRLARKGLEALTPAESRVARLASAGDTNAEIAAKLFLAEKTVEGHLASVFRKLGVRSRRQLVEHLDQPSSL
jgi:DNA-binding CsgD family transcriptional regulator/tetratricopeptide (TPR) repeat protein